MTIKARAKQSKRKKHPPFRSTNDVLLLQPVLAGRIEASVVHRIIVALRQNLHRAVLFLVQLYDPVHDRNVAALDLEHHNVAGLQWVVFIVGEEEQIASIERRLHRPG